MAIDPVTGAEQVVDDIVNQVGANVNSGVKAKAQALDLAAKQDAEQAEVDKAEAASTSFFESGWRPALAWMCVVSMSWFYLFHPFLVWMFGCIDPTITVPVADRPTDMQNIVYALLGLGTMRSFEKYNPWK
jgi:hypothetical protein